MSSNHSLFDENSIELLDSCDVSLGIGVYCTLLLGLSLLSNLTLISILSLIASVAELLPVIINSYICRFIFGYIGCVVIAFYMYWSGCSSIYIMMIISFERYWKLRKPTTPTVNTKALIIAVILCLGLSLIWSVLPVLGWSYYSLEGIRLACSVEWADRSANVMSYNMTIFVMVFALPLIVLVATNLKLILILKRSTKNIMTSMTDCQLQRRYGKEKKLSILSIALIGLFILSWLPYAIVSLYTAFFDDHLSPIVATIPSMFAKSWLLWPSFLTMVTDQDFRECLLIKNKKVVVRSLTNVTNFIQDKIK